ncbi:CRISPR-associated protein Cas4 [Patescibacteria group bacterium]|nr:CRISPR-associated protein Cas4 [Patescibacteria group bacterium]
MRQTFLNATDLMNYLYDPRILYFVHVLKIPQATTTKELEGRQKYEEFEKKSKRNKIIKELPYLPKIYNVYLASKENGFATKIDCVAIDKERKEAYPIQIKYSFKPQALYRTQKFQLVMEAMLIKERLGYKVPYGFIKFLKSSDFVKVWITDEFCLHFLQIFSEIKSIIKEEKLPRPTPYKKKMIDSCYKNIE